MFKSLLLGIVIWLRAIVKGVLMMCTDRSIQQYHPIITSMSVDYEEQVVIIAINSGIQCLICKVPLEKRENLCKIWALRIHESMRT